jgi:hypothetical protein
MYVTGKLNDFTIIALKEKSRALWAELNGKTELISQLVEANLSGV